MCDLGSTIPASYLGAQESKRLAIYLIPFTDRKWQFQPTLENSI